MKALTDMDMVNPSKMSDGGVGAIMFQSQEAAKYERDSVNNVKKRQKLNNKRDSIQKTRSNN
mgnify:CR=1 FL=1